MHFRTNLTNVLCAKLLQSCPTLCDPMDCSPPGSSVHGILQAKILEWVAIPFSRVSSWCRDQTYISYISALAGEFFTTSATWEAPIMYFRANLTNIPSLLFLIAFVTNYHKSPPNLSYGFKARSPKHVSLGQSQGVNRAGSFWRFGEENPFPCPFQLWVAACVL